MGQVWFQGDQFMNEVYKCLQGYNAKRPDT